MAAETEPATEPEQPEQPEPAPAPAETAPAPRALALLGDDLKRGARAAIAGAAALAAFELVVSLIVAQSSFGLGTMVRFLALDVVLVGVMLLVAAPLTALAFAAPRLSLFVTSGERARSYPGLLTRDSGAAPLQSAAPWLTVAPIGILLYAAASYALTLTFLAKFKERHLIAAALAAAQLVVFAVTSALAFLLAAGLRRAGARLAPRLGRWNPFGRVVAAGGLLLLIAIPATVVVLRFVPALRDVVPWRLLMALAVYVTGVAIAARRAFSPRPRFVLAGVAALAVLAVPTLWLFGAHPEAKYLAMTASPPLAKLVDAVRWLNDFDGDGYGSLLGENDCAPFNKSRNPGARDVPDNGIDENCNGRDFSARGLPSHRRGERMAVPAEFRRDWNVLVITIDALRYDHTGFGGYKKTKQRDTTPFLDKLVAKSTSFTFANTTAPGTMAAVPAIHVSRFFHSGIALGPERRPMPPKILPENTLLAEVMKKAGYRTGAILTHEYFNDWGLDQGYESFDNSLGAKPNPKGITSQDVTSKAEAWIAKQGTSKWFLWAHYLDPHGHYVAHPGETQFGDTPEDVYDGEIAYTDKHIGKLLESLARSPVGQKTIIIVTSDHGDGFMEHGFINHGMALYKELMQVPLVVYVPENEPRVVDGPVSNMDVFPTVADLVGADISGLHDIEGESLVPELFYGRDARDWVIFAETNYPDPLRAVITDTYKLVYNLKANVYELYDLHKDAWEKKNLWGKDKAGGDKMKALLDEWLDRVYYARDPLSQAQQVRQAAFLSPKAPNPAHPVSGSVAELRLVGWDPGPGPFVAGGALAVTVWFTVAVTPPVLYHVEAELVAPGEAGAAPRAVARQLKTPAGDGIFPTTKWRPGEYVKEDFRLKMPPDAKGLHDLRLRVVTAEGKEVPWQDGAGEMVLGQISVVAK